jgi:hypothetical protein
MRLRFTLAVAVTAACLAPLLTMPSADAAPPPKGYPTASISCSFKDPGDGLTMITRRGFYDSAANQGFGFDKAYNKHGITSCAAINAVLRSPSRYGTSTGKATVNFNEWAEQWVNGRLAQQVLVTAVYEFGSWATYYGWPAGTPAGSHDHLLQQLR